MSVVRDVYISEFKDMSYKERLYYIVFNDLKLDFSGFKMPLNPLYWNTAHMLKIFIVFPVIFLIFYPFILLPIAAIEAANLKSRYKKEESGWFVSKVRVIK